jgi:MFS family permease
MPRSDLTPGGNAKSSWGTRLWAVVAIVCGAMFLDAMDVSTVNVALPTIGSHLHMSASTLQWVVSGYVLGYGGFLLLGGRTSDLLGRRRVFVAALAVFAAASALGGAVNDGTLLIVARMIKGVAAAFTVPAGLSILTTTFPEGPSRNKALGLYGTSGAAGFSLGLVIGGLLTQLGWRYVFLVPTPIALTMLLGALRVLEPAEAPSPANRRYDLLGAITVTASMLALVYSIVEVPTRGWSDSRTIGGLILGALLLAVFVMVERRAAQPLVRLGILRTPTLWSADLAAVLWFGSYLGYQFLATLYVQSVAGWSPITAALAFLPQGAFLPILGGQTERLIGRFGTARLVAAGLAAFAIGYALLLREHSMHLDYASMLLPTTAAIGIGWGLGFPALNVQATAGVAAREQGLAAGLFNTSFQIGGALFVAITSAVVSSHTTGAGGHQATAILDSIRPTLVILIPVALGGVLALYAGTRFRPAATKRDMVMSNAELGDACST